MQPPWMASVGGHIHPGVERLTGRGGSVLGVHVSQMVMGPIGNQVAAMPSLHAAFALLLALYLWRLVPRYTRPLLAVYPPLMTLALVYSGEHYLVDCIAGWVYAVVTFVGVNWYFAWRERRAPQLQPAYAD